MADEIIELLKNKKLRAEVVKTIKDVYSHAGTLHDNPAEDMKEAVEELGTTLWEEAWWRAETFGKVGQIERAFKKYVFDKMQKPYRISPKEIIDNFYNLAFPGQIGCPELENVDPDNLYTIFISNLNCHVLSASDSKPFLVCMIPNVEYYRRQLVGIESSIEIIKQDEDLLLWRNNGISVYLWGRTSYREHISLSATITGRMSVLACQQLRTEISRILATVIQSISVLWPQDMLQRQYRSIKNLPFINEKLLQSKKVLIQKSLDAYFREPTKKDSFGQRIRNAVHLLIESDAQSNDAVGLALSVAAIDALLGEKGRDMVEKLSTNVAVLLEPDLEKRGNAKNFVRDIYDHRSRALHGEKIETESDSRIKARHLAAGVLAGIVSRRDFLSRSGFDTERPQELLLGLRESQFAPGQPIGVEESNVGELWSNK